MVHVLWDCPAATDVWGDESSIFCKWKSYHSDFHMLWMEMGKKLSKDRLELASVMFYQLWARRNSVIFQNQFVHPSILARKARNVLTDFQEVNLMCSQGTEGNTKRGAEQKWKPPAWPYVKVNFDAAFEKVNSRMGIGVIVRDSNGRLQAVVTATREHISSVAQAECVALLRAMKLCIELGFNQVSFEGDAKAIIDAVNSKREDNSRNGQLIEDLQQLMSRNQAWSLCFAPRSVNKVAHMAAKVAFKNISEKVWLNDGPPEVLHLVLGEAVMPDVMLC